MVIDGGAIWEYPLSAATKVGGGLAFHSMTYSPSSTRQIFIEYLLNIHYAPSNVEGQVPCPSGQTVQQKKAVSDDPTEVWPQAFQFPG